MMKFGRPFAFLSFIGSDKTGDVTVDLDTTKDYDSRAKLQNYRLRFLQFTR